MASPLDDVAGIRARLRARRGELTSASVRDRVPLDSLREPCRRLVGCTPCTTTRSRRRLMGAAFSR